MDMNMDIVQFKLINGEEIICNIVEGTNEDEIQISHALRLRETQILHQDETHEIRGYQMTPWMTYQMDMTLSVSLNSNHIVAKVIPQDYVKKHYMQCLTTLEETMMDFGEGFEDMTNTNKDSDNSNIIKLRLH